MLKKQPTPLTIVPPQTALRLEAIRDFVDGDAKHVAGVCVCVCACVCMCIFVCAM